MQDIQGIIYVGNKIHLKAMLDSNARFELDFQDIANQSFENLTDDIIQVSNPLLQHEIEETIISSCKYMAEYADQVSNFRLKQDIEAIHKGIKYATEDIVRVLNARLKQDIQETIYLPHNSLTEYIV